MIGKHLKHFLLINFLKIIFVHQLYSIIELDKFRILLKFQVDFVVFCLKNKIYRNLIYCTIEFTLALLLSIVAGSGTFAAMSGNFDDNRRRNNPFGVKMCFEIDENIFIL